MKLSTISLLALLASASADPSSKSSKAYLVFSGPRPKSAKAASTTKAGKCTEQPSSQPSELPSSQPSEMPSSRSDSSAKAEKMAYVETPAPITPFPTEPALTPPPPTPPPTPSPTVGYNSKASKSSPPSKSGKSCGESRVVIARDDEVSTILPPASDDIRVDVLDNDTTTPSGGPSGDEDTGEELFVTSIIDGPSSGTCTTPDDGSAVVFAPPDELFVGEVSCEYEACTEDVLVCDTAVVTITILPDVVAVDDSVSADSTASPIEVDVLANDFTTPPGEELIVSSIVVGPTAGTCVPSGDGTMVVYTPPSSSFVGEVSCEYEACTEDGLVCDTAVVTITILPDVVAVDDSVSADSTASPIEVDVLANDFTTPPGEELIVSSIVVGPEDGTCAPTADGTMVVYTPPSSSFVGEVSCEYEACTVDGLVCDTAVLTVTFTRSPSDRPTLVSLLSRANREFLCLCSFFQLTYLVPFLSPLYI